MKRLAWVSACALVVATPQVLSAGQRTNPFTGRPDYCITLQETDGSPSNLSCQQLNVSNGTLTDNGNGTFALTTGGASIGGTIPAGTTGSVLFVGSGPVIQQNNANLFWNDTTLRLGIGTSSPSAQLHLSQAVSTSGSPTDLLVDGAAHTTLAASTEASDVNFNLARTVQFATGALTTQRAVRVQAPTYGFVGASTVTNASTMEISGIPVAGANATLTDASALRIPAGAGASTTTNAYGLYVDAPTGATNNYAARLVGDIRVGGGTTNITSPNTAGDNIIIKAGQQSSLEIGNRFTLNAGSGQINQIQVGGTNLIRLDGTSAEINTQGTLSNNIMDLTPGLWNGNAGWNDTGNALPMVRIRSTVNQTGASGYIGLRVNITETATGTGTNNLLELQTGGVNRCAVSNRANTTLSQVASTSGSPTLLTLTGAAHTTLGASAEAVDVNLNLARTVQFATGALTTQRAVVVQAPTYGFVGASTLTTASTVAISGAPVAGANATITNPYSLWVQGGLTKFDGGMGMAVVSKTATYTMTREDTVVLSSASGGAFTVTLPAASIAGMKVVVIKTDNSANVVTVSRAGTDTIQGSTTKSLALQYDKFEGVADGTSTWYDLGTGLI